MYLFNGQIVMKNLAAALVLCFFCACHDIYQKEGKDNSSSLHRDDDFFSNEIVRFKNVDIAAECKANIERGDLRFRSMGTAGSNYIPGLDTYEITEKGVHPLIEKYGQTMMKETSDVIMSSLHREYTLAARDYARKYNLERIRQLKIDVPPKAGPMK